MNYHQAIDMAIVALDEQRQRFAFNANLSALGMASSMKRNKERYDEINEAIKMLTELRDRIGKDGTIKMF